MNVKAKKGLKITAIVLASVIGAMILTVGIYVIYMCAQYYRIGDNLEIATSQNKSAVMELSRDYKISTYNIGFGAYNHDFSFFMDSGVMKSGKKVTGKDSRAKSKQVVLDNTNGAIEASKKIGADFYLFQEVDTKSTRSHNVNQYEMLDAFGSDFSKTFAVNFHSAFLFYPIFNPHGSVNAGLATLSKYKIDSSVRRSYPIDMGFPTKFFDLDRCFLVSRLPTENGKEFVLINSHMSAYDKGGTVRREQLALLNSVMSEEYAKGNYVVVGGDFNHVLMGTENTFAREQEVPEWVFSLDNSLIPEQFYIVAGTNAPSCRSTDIPYQKGVNYSAVLDGFIISDNIEVKDVTIVDLDFQYSDHNPSALKFALL